LRAVHIKNDHRQAFDALAGGRAQSRHAAKQLVLSASNKAWACGQRGRHIGAWRIARRHSRLTRSRDSRFRKTGDDTDSAAGLRRRRGSEALNHLRQLRARVRDLARRGHSEPDEDNKRTYKQRT
jgi:hypothetical protein